jgi:hypothetical protein
MVANCGARVELMAIVEISINIASNFMGIIDGQLILMVISFELEIDFVI